MAIVTKTGTPDRRTQVQAAEQETYQAGETFSALVWKQFRKNRPAVAGLLAICVLASIAVFADCLAGNTPYYMEYNGKVYYPVFRQYIIYLGLTEWPQEFRSRRNFKRFKAERIIFPPIPYAPNEIDLNEKYQPPNARHLLEGVRKGVL